MPAIVGPTQILSVDGGVVQFGDAVFISPKTSSKTVAGSGSASAGAFVSTFNGISINNTFDTNLIDQPMIGNN